jgi:hypothetical protein
MDTGSVAKPVGVVKIFCFADIRRIFINWIINWELEDDLAVSGNVILNWNLPSGVAVSV